MQLIPSFSCLIKRGKYYLLQDILLYLQILSDSKAPECVQSFKHMSPHIPSMAFYWWCLRNKDQFKRNVIPLSIATDFDHPLHMISLDSDLMQPWDVIYIKIIDDQIALP